MYAVGTSYLHFLIHWRRIIDEHNLGEQHYGSFIFFERHLVPVVFLLLLFSFFLARSNQPVKCVFYLLTHYICFARLNLF